MPSDAPTGTSVLRRLNTAAVLDVLRRRAGTPLRITELAERTRLARPTVTQAVDDLVGAGWISAVAPGPSATRLGRPATLYRLRRKALPVAGVDVGPHQVSVGIADLAGETLALVRRQFTEPGVAGSMIGLIDDALEACLRQSDVTATDIAEVVVGSPGIIDAAHGAIRLVPSVPGWPTAGVLEHLGTRMSCAMHLENDANLAAFDAAGRFPGETLLVIQWGERLGAGVVISGVLHKGANDAAGEIGFIPAGDEGVGPDADGRGSLERDVGAQGIADAAREAIVRHPDSALAHLDAGDLTPITVFRAAGQDDVAAREVVGRVARRFCSALAPVLLALNPHAIVIGGGLARAGSVLLDALRLRLGELTLSPPRLELSEQAERAVVAGAMRMAGEHVWERCLAGPVPRSERVSTGEQ